MTPTSSCRKDNRCVRLAITDHCNTDCNYCLVANNGETPTRERMLRFEELLRIARAAVECGIGNIRVTGGEPLAREGLIPFLRDLSAVPDMQQLDLTTNGLLLETMAEELRAAGVNHLNIRLDSLDEDTYAEITGGRDFTQALRGIAAAERAGLPLTLNMVVMKGINDHEIIDFARLTIDGPVTVRFIEFLPTTREEGWHDHVVPGDEIIAQIAEKLPLEPMESDGQGIANEFRIAGARGTIRITMPVSGHACRECSSIRITAAGTAKGCVAATEDVDLQPWLDAPDHHLLTTAIRQLATARP